MGLEPGVELAQYDLVNVTTTPEQRILRGAGLYTKYTLHANSKCYLLLNLFVGAQRSSP